MYTWITKQWRTNSIHQFHIIPQYSDFVCPQTLHEYFFQFLYGLTIGPFMKVLGVNRVYNMGWCGSGQYHFRFKRLPYWRNYKARYCCCTCYSTSTVSPLIFGSSEKGTSGTLHFSNSNTKSWKKETETKLIRGRFVKLAFTFSADNLRCSVRFRCTLSALVNSLLITPSHLRYFT